MSDDERQARMEGEKERQGAMKREMGDLLQAIHQSLNASEAQPPWRQVV